MAKKKKEKSTITSKAEFTRKLNRLIKMRRVMEKAKKIDKELAALVKGYMIEEKLKEAEGEAGSVTLYPSTPYSMTVADLRKALKAAANEFLGVKLDKLRKEKGNEFVEKHGTAGKKQTKLLVKPAKKPDVATLKLAS